MLFRSSGISESLIKGKSVVVKDDIIEDITEDILAYKDYKIIDLKNKYLMPGLINLHVHLPGSGNPNGGKIIIINKTHYPILMLL